MALFGRELALFAVIIVGLVRTETINYDAKNRTVLLKLELDKMPDRKMMDSFVSSVLRWPVEEDCSSARCTDLKDTFEATVRSSRICLDSASTHSSFCDVITSTGQDQVQVVHRHISTGCYCFRLSSYRDDNIRMAWHLIDRPFYLSANNETTEYDVFKWNVSLDLSATSRNDLRLTIEQLEDDYLSADFESYHVDLYRIPSADSPCIETVSEDPMNEHLDVFEGAGQTVAVSFVNRSFGSYCVIVAPNDDRCDHPSETCARHSNTVTLDGAWKEPEPLLTSTASSDSLITACSIALAVVILLFVTAIAIRRMLKRQKPQRPSVFGPLLIDDFRSSPIEQSPPSLLLFHSHRMGDDERPLRQIRDTLRHHFSDCQIFDDAEQVEEACIEGAEWFWTRLTQPGVRVVVIFCRQMLACQQHLLSMRSGPPLDPLLFQRFQQLLHHSVSNMNNLYQRVFVIRLDDGLEWPETCLLTPYTTYSWPSDQSSLVAALQGPSGGILKHSPSAVQQIKSPTSHDALI